MKAKILFFILLSCAMYGLQGQVSGTVFRDFNGNGTKEMNEPLVPGITVNAYNAAGTICGTTTSSGFSAPNYTVVGCGSAAVRLEFIMPNSGLCVNSDTDYSSFAGAENGTSVQFRMFYW